MSDLEKKLDYEEIDEREYRMLRMGDHHSLKILNLYKADGVDRLCVIMRFV